MASAIFLFVALCLGLGSAAPTAAPSCPKLKVYVAYEYGALIISENGGLTWARRDTGGISTINSIWAVNTTVFLGTDDGLAISKNGGHTWAMQYFANNYKAISSVYGVGKRVLLACYANLTISEDLGQTWTVQTIPKSTDYLHSVYATDKRIFVALGGTRYGDGFAMSDDGGVSWRVLLTDTPFEMTDGIAIAGSGDDVYVQLSQDYASELPRDSASIAISNDGGETWGIQEITTFAAQGLANNIAVDGGTVLVGTTVGLAMSDDVWDEWTLKTTADGLPGNSTKVAAYDGIIFAGTDKGLSISSDRGTTWTSPNTPLADQKVMAIFVHCLN